MKFMWYEKFRCCFNRRVSILKMSNVRKKVGKIVFEKWFLRNRKIHFNRIPSHTFFPLFASLAFPLIGLDEVVLSLFLRIFVWDFLLSTPLSLGIFDFEGCLILGPFSALRVKEDQFLRANSVFLFFSDTSRGKLVWNKSCSQIGNLLFYISFNLLTSNFWLAERLYFYFRFLPSVPRNLAMSLGRASRGAALVVITR